MSPEDQDGLGAGIGVAAWLGIWGWLKGWMHMLKRMD